ncbi:MAG: cation diffusion facilitator family transporter [Rhodospirillaceae bacterium]|nr:cation diffusion facilitator family transporter [Rhodospirillaceae bacterium]
MHNHIDYNKDISTSREDNKRLMRLATYAAVAVAGSLVSIKFVAWIMTDSVSLLSTMIDSLLDVAASTVNLFAIRHALQPADEEHRFGHGKAEALAGLAQSAFISGSAMFLVIEAFDRIFHPRIIESFTTGYVVMIVSIVATLGLVIFQRYVAKKTGSLAIAADSTHYKMDVLVNASVILSLFLVSRFDWGIADPLFAIGIAAYIFHGAYEIGIEAYHVLMDRELPDEDRAKIRDIAVSHKDVLDIHDLRTRSSGSDMFIQLHLEMDPNITLVRAHDIAEEVMHMIEKEFPRAEVLTHQDPHGADEQVAFEN